MGNKLKRLRRQQNGAQASIHVPLHREDSFKWSHNRNKKVTIVFMGHNIDRVATELQFHESLEKDIKQNDIENLRNLFKMTKATLNQTSGSLHFWLNDNQSFTKIYLKEFCRYRSLRYEDEELTVAQRVSRHCKAALLIHIKLVESLNEPQKLDRILKQIAASHIFLSKSLVCIKKHDESMVRFMKHEFNEYVDKNTFQSMQKYFQLISGRIQILLDACLHERSIQNMVDSMNGLKMLINSNPVSTPEGKSLKSLYTNSQDDCMQSYILSGMFTDSEESINS